MDRIVRSVEVAVEPAVAFAAFTDEMGAWYGDLPHAWNDPDRAVGIRLEPRVGGRWLEVWDDATGEGYEIGRVLEWEPPRRLVTTYRNIGLAPGALTEIEVRFDPVPGGTCVTLEHRGWERLDTETFVLWRDRAWVALMGVFAEYVRGGRE